MQIVQKFRNKILEFNFDFKRRSQRFLRGYSDSDTWNIGSWVIETSLPALKKYKKGMIAYPFIPTGKSDPITGEPENEMTFEEWNKILDEIIEGFELYCQLEINCDDRNWFEYYRSRQFVTDYEKIDRACKLFGEHLLSLWD